MSEHQLRRRRLSRAGVPPRYLDPFEEARVPSGVPLAALRTWDRRRSWCVFFSGPPGVGKSFVAVYLLDLYLVEIECQEDGFHREGPRGLWVRAADYVTGALSPNALHEGAPYHAAPFLVLDDFGRGYHAPAASATVHGLIAGRYDHKRATVVTTNHSLADLDRSLLDRLREGQLIEIEGDSQRMPPAKDRP